MTRSAARARDPLPVRAAVKVIGEALGPATAATLSGSPELVAQGYLNITLRQASDPGTKVTSEAETGRRRPVCFAPDASTDAVLQTAARQSGFPEESPPARINLARRRRLRGKPRRPRQLVKVGANSSPTRQSATWLTRSEGTKHLDRPPSDSESHGHGDEDAAQYRDTRATRRKSRRTGPPPRTCSRTVDPFGVTTPAYGSQPSNGLFGFQRGLADSNSLVLPRVSCPRSAASSTGHRNTSLIGEH